MTGTGERAGPATMDHVDMTGTGGDWVRRQRPLDY
jgi:hypothetical protein